MARLGLSFTVDCRSHSAGCAISARWHGNCVCFSSGGSIVIFRIQRLHDAATHSLAWPRPTTKPYPCAPTVDANLFHRRSSGESPHRKAGRGFSPESRGPLGRRGSSAPGRQRSASRSFVEWIAIATTCWHSPVAHSKPTRRIFVATEKLFLVFPTGKTERVEMWLPIDALPHRGL